MQRNQIPHKTILQCSLFSNQICTFLSKGNNIDISLTNTILVYFFDKFDIHLMLDISKSIPTLNATINYISSTNRFEESYFQCFVISAIYPFFNFFLYLYVFFETIQFILIQFLGSLYLLTVFQIFFLFIPRCLLKIKGTWRL